MSNTVTTTQLCKHFGVQFKPETLIEAGVEPVSKVKNGYNWNVGDIPAIGEAVIDLIESKRHSKIDLSEVASKPKPAAKASAKKAAEPDPLNDDDEDDDESL